MITKNELENKLAISIMTTGHRNRTPREIAEVVIHTLEQLGIIKFEDIGLDEIVIGVHSI